MKIVLLSVGKTNIDFIREGIDEYLKRLKFYVKFENIELNVLKNSKNLSKNELLKKEAELILSNISDNDFVINLDEKGRGLSSSEFAKQISKYRIMSKKKIVFIIGGAYGFSEEIYSRSNDSISLSSMTFSHQMVRLFFVEQLYRSFTILNNESYHHE
jgi:23S rRNA (pseudouridine1915-N3)-methyltransferase|tara:strand:+ start:1157 stop:1630 length:474 start_codon:yes stop_codon:yes gene_type:complete